MILTNSSRGQSRAQPGNCKGYGGAALSFRKNIRTEAELHAQAETESGLLPTSATTTWWTVKLCGDTACVLECVLPVVVPVQLKDVTGSVRWLSVIEHIQASLKSDDSGVVLRAHERNRLAYLDTEI